MSRKSKRRAHNGGMPPLDNYATKETAAGQLLSGSPPEASAHRELSRELRVARRPRPAPALASAHNVPIARGGLVPLMTAWSSQHGGLGQHLIKPRRTDLPEWLKTYAILRAVRKPPQTRLLTTNYRSPRGAYTPALSLRLAEIRANKLAAKKAGAV